MGILPDVEHFHFTNPIPMSNDLAQVYVILIWPPWDTSLETSLIATIPAAAPITTRVLTTPPGILSDCIYSCTAASKSVPRSKGYLSVLFLTYHGHNTCCVKLYDFKTQFKMAKYQFGGWSAIRQTTKLNTPPFMLRIRYLFFIYKLYKHIYTYYISRLTVVSHEAKEEVPCDRHVTHTWVFYKKKPC